MSPKLANRTESLVQSEIRAISLQIAEVNGINLGQGICDMPTPPTIREAAKDAIDANKSIYSNYAGIRPLREGILAKAREYNKIPLTSIDQIVVSAGSTGAFSTAMLAILNPGDEVILFEPFYGYHRHLLQAFGATVRYVGLNKPDWSLDWDSLYETVNNRTKAIVLTTPANPCGKVWSKQDLERVLDLAKAKNLFVVTDEIYEYMLYDGREHVSLASLPDAFERTITLSGFSKTYNMTGWRLGYVSAPSPLIDKIGLLNDLLYICAPTPLQYGVAAAFEMPETYFEELTIAYTLKRKLLCETLERIGFELYWPEGSYYVLASFESLGNTRRGFADDHEACQTLINEAGIGTVRGASFFNNPDDGKHYLRFCYAKELPVLEEACARLERAFG